MIAPRRCFERRGVFRLSARACQKKIQFVLNMVTSRLEIELASLCVNGGNLFGGGESGQFDSKLLDCLFHPVKIFPVSLAVKFTHRLPVNLCPMAREPICKPLPEVCISVKPVKTAERVFWILRHNSHVIRACKFRNMRDSAKPCADSLA